jgi:uncharacterized membrane protein YbhN (UPF0104 family)
VKGWFNADRKRLFTLLGFGFYLLVALFLILYTQSLDWRSIANLEIQWLFIAVATVLGLVTRFWFARIWIFFLTNSGAKFSREITLELYSVYAKSWLGRYIPGSVAWVLGKVYFASKLGISKTRLAISSFIEAVLQIVTVLLTASVLLALDPRSYQLAGNWIWLVLVFAILGLIAVLPPVLRVYAGKAYELMRKVKLDESLIPKNAVLGRGILYFVVSSMLSGLAFYFVALSIAPEIGIKELLFVLAASNLASAVSMVAVFAPAGVGVREAIQIAALLFVMSPEQALAATILMRVLSIFWDGMFLGLATLFKAAK